MCRIVLLSSRIDFFEFAEIVHLHLQGTVEAGSNHEAEYQGTDGLRVGKCNTIRYTISNDHDRSSNSAL
jgi:ribosomal protein L21E